MDLSLFFLGTGGATPSAQRGLPATLIRRGGEQLLVDCGEGTQRQLVRSVGLSDLDCVLITHFHADHWLGLPGMLKSFALREREKPLSIYGPPGLSELMRAISFVYGKLPYPLEIEELEPAHALRRDGYAIVAVPVRHRIAIAYGYVLIEDQRPGHLDAAEAERLGVRPGPDFGRLQRGETVAGVRPEQVMGPPRDGRKVVLTGDTAPCEAVRIAADGADVLVHEATFAKADEKRAQQTLHSTAEQAAAIASAAHVKLLVITHVSGRYAGGQLRDEARAVFAATEAPRDFDAIVVPFPERGGPHLIRWRANAAGAPPTGGPTNAGRGRSAVEGSVRRDQDAEREAGGHLPAGLSTHAQNASAWDGDAVSCA